MIRVGHVPAETLRPRKRCTYRGGLWAGALRHIGKMRDAMSRVSLASAVVLLAALGALGAGAPANPYETAAAPTPDTQIDKLVFARLEKLGIEPAHLCSDAVFVRRVYLDVIGTLPTAQEAREFFQDKDPQKRRALIDRLLERDEFADYWAMKWGDLLRVKAEFPINLWPNAAQAYHRWIRTSIKENMPYDRFVREMLTANGSCFQSPPVNFYRAMQNREPQGIAQTVALTFMGMRTDTWPKERLSGMAAFFSLISYKSTGEWKEEIVTFDPDKKAAPAAATQAAAAGTTQTASGATQAATGTTLKVAGATQAAATSVTPQAAIFPDGTAARLTAGQDPRAVFADWLTAPRNAYFARAIANRVWSWLVGRGIVHEADDMRPDNPPANPELLAHLEQQMVAVRYDMKEFMRLILNSKTYQLSSIPRTERPEGAANFAYYPLRRLEAEVLIDALDQITGTTEKYTSAIPEPFTFIPENLRSIALPDGSITSSFLEMFGRPSRDTGLESERNSRPTADQRLHMLNSSHIQRKLEQSKKLQYLTQSRSEPREVVAGLYLMILSRWPTEEEMKTALAYSGPGGAKGREAAMDIAWALINSTEFLYRH